jgi:hypothetical protein
MDYPEKTNSKRRPKELKYRIINIIRREFMSNFGGFGGMGGLPMIIIGLLYGFIVVMAGLLMIYGSYVWMVIREIAFNTRKAEGGDKYPQIDRYCSLQRILGVVFIALGLLLAVFLIVVGVMGLRNY